jgi:citrate synthase
VWIAVNRAARVRYAKTQEFFVKIGSQAHRSSSISTSNDTTILVRGRDLAKELVGEINFTEHFWFLLTGALPSTAQRTVLDATLVAIAEHGMVPSVQASRLTLAASPESLQGAVAAGILGCGSVVLGSSESAGLFFSDILNRASSKEGIEVAAEDIIRQYVASGRAIPGYGHPLHKDFDPRALKLFQIAERALGGGVHMDLARTVERLLPAMIGKPLAINVSGAIPAVLLDAGYPLGALKGVPLLARTAGLIAHLLEEQLKPIGFVMSHAAAAAISYDGERPDGFQVAHD